MSFLVPKPCLGDSENPGDIPAFFLHGLVLAGLTDQTAAVGLFDQDGMLKLNKPENGFDVFCSPGDRHLRGDEWFESS
jgi:hypothetical protein